MSLADATSAALSQAWPPFVLVAALLAIGAVADADGVFTAAARAIARPGASPTAVLAGLLGLTALTSALLNLDTATAFLTPVLLYAARDLATDEAPFLYGSVLMANAGSLFLPGSNLTNLLVLGHGGTSGAAFLSTMWLPALAAVLITAATLLLWGWLRLRPPEVPEPQPPQGAPARSGRSGRSGRPGVVGVAAIAVAAVCVVALREPALPVLGVAAVAAAIAVARRRVTLAGLVGTIGPLSLAGLLALAVALGTLAREWSGPADLLAEAGAWGTAGIGALAAVTVNNLPAATLLSADAPGHPYALLIGLDLGPNLAVTGSLSALIWWRSAKRLGAAPSVVTFSRVGAPAALISGLAALALLSAAH